MARHLGSRVCGIMAVLLVLSIQACTTFQGEYVDPNSVDIMTDRWNETDARTTSEKLIRSMVNKPWLSVFKKANAGKRPVVVLADIENRTDEHIDTRALAEAIRDEAINSGRIRFVDDGKGRDKILKEIQYQNQSGMVSKTSAKRKGRQVGADFILRGAISSNVQTRGGKKTVTYQTVLQLTDLESAELSWSDKHKLKKRLEQSGASW